MPRTEFGSGAIEGDAAHGAERYRGIPYAAAAIEGRRFQRPERVAPWSGCLDARQPGPAPLQPRIVGLGMRGADRQSEDCLTLNVFTPACDAASRPVLVWIFGGGYVNGDGADPLFDGSRLAVEEDLVVVTFNYRLGALGFASIDQSNCGLADQIAVLSWVQDNIERFGGNSNSVTIVGESAGAMSVCNLLASPAAEGLFHRAIAQSGAADNVASAAQAAASAAALQAGLAGPAATAPAPMILAAQAAAIARLRPLQRAMPFRPWVDDDLLPALPAAVASRARIPLILGMNRDEQRLYVRPSLKLEDAALLAQLERRLHGLVGEPAVAARHVFEHYLQERPPSPINANAAVLADVDTELRFRRPLLRYARARRAPTWLYQFDWPSPALRGWLGACHAVEIPFVFGNFDLPSTAKFVGAGADAESLSRRIMALWGAFARDGHPPAHWPAFDTGEPRQLHLDRDITVRRLADDATIAFWNDLL